MSDVVVVGGGIAGVSTIAALRGGGFDGDVTLIDTGEFPHDRPPLSKEYLAGEVDAKDIALQPHRWYDDNRVRLMNQTTVTALKPGSGEVQLGGGRTVRARWVVLATGGVAARPPIPGSKSSRVHTLRTCVDADRLRAALLPGARVLIVGAGLIGAEVASTASGLSCEVVLVDPVSAPLAAAFGADVAAWLHDVHAQRGITVVRGSVECFRDTDSGVVAMMSGEQGGTGCFDAVVLAVGMVPETGVALTAGLRATHGIIVDDGQMTSNPAILAVGDAARTRSVGRLLDRTEHWEAATHDGGRAAASILGAAPPADTAPWFWTDRHDLHVEAVGAPASGDTVVVRGIFGAAPFSVFALHATRVVGAVSVNDAAAVRAARRMIDRSIDVDPDGLADPGTDLRKLLRG